MIGRTFSSAAVTCALFVLPYIASAHAVPISSTPAEFDASVEMPASVLIRFSERIEPSASTIEILDPAGKPLSGDPASLSPSDPRALVRMIPPGIHAEGPYRVVWQVVSSDDGHFTRGTFPFFLGTGDASAAMVGSSFEIVHSASKTEAFTIALKLLGEAVVLGVFAFALLFARSARSRAIPELLPLLARRLTLARLAGFGILLSGAVAYFVYKTFQLAAAQGSDLLAALPRYAATTGGTHTIALAVLALVAFVISRGMIDRLMVLGRLGLREYILALVLLSASYTQARLSHAAASLFLPDFSIAVNVVHLLGKGLWVGGLLVFAFVILPLASFPAFGQTIRIEGKRLLGRIVAPAIGLAGVSGAWIVWLHLKGAENLLTTGWGKAAIMLMIFGGLLFALRLFSLFVSERMRRCLDCERSFATLETLVALALLALSATIIITTPPLFARPLWMAHSPSASGMVMFEDPGGEQQKLRVRAYAPDGAPLPLQHATIVLSERDQGIGPIVLPERYHAKTEAEIGTSLLTPPGIWTIDVSVPQAKRYDAVGHADIRFPDDLLAARAAAAEHRVDVFALACLAAALFFVASAIVLWRRTAANAVYAEAHVEELDGSPIGFWRGQGIALLAFVLFAISVAVIVPAITPSVSMQGMHAGHQMP